MRALPVVILLAACSSPNDELASMAKQGATCSADGDCCVVVEGCMAETYVIGKADFEKAKQLAADAAGPPCTACIPPYVDVRCSPDTKRCEGREVSIEAGPTTLKKLGDHCGAVVLDAWPAETGQVSMGCGAE